MIPSGNILLLETKTSKLAETYHIWKQKFCEWVIETFPFLPLDF